MAHRLLAFSEEQLAFLVARKMQSFRKYLSRQLPPLGKVIRVDSIKIANEVRAHAGTRRIDLSPTPYA